MTDAARLAAAFRDHAIAEVKKRPGEWVRVVQVFTEPDEVAAILEDPDAFVSAMIGGLGRQ